MAKTTNNDAAAEKSTLNRIKLLNSIAKLEAQIAKDYEKSGQYNVELNKQLDKSQKNLVKIDKYLNGNNQKIKDGIDLYKESADSISSMSSMMGGLKDELKKTTEFGIQFSKSIATTAGRNKAVFTDSNKLLSEMTYLTSDLAQLNKEDAVEIASKANELDSLYKKLSNNISSLEKKGDRLSKGDKELLRVLKERFEVTKGLIVQASQFANLGKLTKEIYEELGSELETIQKTFQKIAVTAQIFFSSFKNAAGVTLFYIGGLVDDFNELAKGIGGTVTQMFQLKAQSFLVSKLLGDEAGKGVTALSQKLGNANDVTLGMSINVGVMSGRLGVSGEEAATLVNQFGNLSGLSNSTALNTMEAASQLASANGVAPAAVMSDIAQNTEAFALYAKDGGANMAQAAIEAHRLGVDLQTAAKISDNLLDYQTSVQSEMEASVLLGRNLNLNKARELAYAGDTAGAMKEALNAAGGIEKFNEMDVYQKKAVAEALGTSVAELQQMSANMERAATPAGKLEATFSSVTGFVQEMGQGIAGTAVKGIGGMLIGMKDFKSQVSEAKEGFTFLKDMGKGIGGLFTKRNFSGFKGITDSADTSAIKNLGKGGAISPTTPKGAKGAGSEAKTAAGQKQLAGGFTAMGEPGVRKGIINSALAGPALFLLSLGTPGMMAVGAFGIKAGKGLTALVPGLIAFGAVPISAAGTLAATGAALLLLSLGTPGMIAVGSLGAAAGTGLSELSVGLLAFSAIPITAVGTLAATGLAFGVMTLGSVGLAAVALGGAAAGAGLISLAGGLEAMGVAAATGLPFLGIALLAGFGAAMIPLTYALSLLEPLITSIGNTIVNVITAISSGITQIVGSITTMMTAILPLLSMDSALGLLGVAGGFWALSASLMAFAGASLLAVPGMLAVGGFMALGGDVMLGGNTANAEKEGEGGLLEEIRGLRADIKQLAVVVNLDNRQIYKGHVQNIKNNSQG